ncbi:MAG TPA: helicase-related protein [Oscillospiraceae bacterium]|nr:helicase-related protein [Oscillospiraceae bacterium]HRW57003.1 helicase-related protein [Oscillospiraceae bacterium]
MDGQNIVSKVNIFLHEAATALVAWLEGILPRVTNTWWDDCVLPSLSYTQREIATSNGFSKLSDFDLVALLRITYKSWYDMRTVAYLPTSEREVVRKMMNVRNNWAHCSAELPGKDTIIGDLHTISSLISQIGGSISVCTDIDEYILYIEEPDSISSSVAKPEQFAKTEARPKDSNEADGSIHENSLVYLVGFPQTKGIVVSVKDLGTVTKYDVFVNNALRSFYTGQIALVEAITGYDWVHIDTIRSYLTAYQINNPSSQNLYSLNSARIDFIPYQFRPALKLIHADEPRILIADSVGVGKTIEAGLIIKELEARNELERIAVICPRPLVAERKWELEMKRFDEVFIPIDGTTLRQIISDTDRDGEWPIRYNKVIIPYSILDSRTYNGENQKGVKSFGLSELDPEPHFDLVIVDEAHHIRNGSMDREKAFAYKCTKYFCDHADAVVMLTATPLQTGDNDLFTILNVLRPDVVIDQKTFAMMSRPNEYISRAVHIIRAAEDGWAEAAAHELLDVQKTQWGDNVIAENPLYDDILIRLEKGNITREERVKLISDIESLHSFSTMLNRTRRRDIQDFCVRRSHTISTEFTEYQRELHDELLSFEKRALSVLHNDRSVPFMMSTIKRQAASCIFGLAPHIRDIISRRIQQMNDSPDSDFSGYDMDGMLADAISSLARRVLEFADNLPEEDPKFEETLKIIRLKQEMPNNKIMLFSTFRHTLAYLKRKLSTLGYRVEQVDGSVKDEQRYELKSRFEHPKEDGDAIDILLFTEVGSEGLDYQFCDMMINYDLPWNPMRIEQRIGRIDRRGQQSEAVNIYNIITENTVDADIYYRCLLRIGVFESSIGECEEILGEIATGIESIVLDTTLTEAERKIKLEQIADNEVRKVQEITRLEEEEKELFGFDLTEFITAQEIRRAENPWLTQQCLQRLVEQYLKERIGAGFYIIGEMALKNLRLSASARGILRDDLRKLPGGRNALRRSWENYLSGNRPNHPLTFDPDAASKNRDSFFITSMHPLAKQAAEYFSGNDTAYLRLQYYSTSIPAGTYLFTVFAWKYVGFNTYTRLVTVCKNEVIATELPDILEFAANMPYGRDECYDWSGLENMHVQMWMNARDAHKRDVNTTTTFKLESLANNQRNLVRSLEQQINDAYDDSIRRMRMSELETVQENYSRKVNSIKEAASRADIYTTLLVNGIITIMEE